MKIARQLVLAFLLCWAAVAVADVAVPQLTARVTDQTGTLSAADISNLDQKLAAFEARKGSQIAVLIVPTTQPEDIAQYSVRVVEQWKLGRKGVDDGVLLLVAKDDRRLRIEVG
ncbi:MAG: TPM domain-containing protein, partial [Afipia sp.]|nr:TPM domain-containing protein [Afipia sp.]